jgi:hypothetical protein
MKQFTWFRKTKSFLSGLESNKFLMGLKRRKKNHYKVWIEAKKVHFALL